MTAATVDKRFRGLVFETEHVLLDITEAYTHVSDMSSPQFCHITIREDIDADVNYTLFGKTLTFHESGGAGVKVAVTIYGYK